MIRGKAGATTANQHKGSGFNAGYYNQLKEIRNKQNQDWHNSKYRRPLLSLSHSHSLSPHSLSRSLSPHSLSHLTLSLTSSLTSHSHSLSLSLSLTSTLSGYHRNVYTRSLILIMLGEKVLFIN
jgi:hypothetical protein